MEIHEMNQIQIDVLIRQWMKETGRTLINLVSISGIDYTRIKKLEHGEEKTLDIITEPELAKLLRILQY